MATPTIFIGYRRNDTVGHAGRIFDRLVEQFGKEHVYLDIDTIPVGEDFVEAVHEKINRSDILLTLIGPRWLTAADEEGRWRLADENDLVRVEIVTALGRNIRMIPVLLQEAEVQATLKNPDEIRQSRNDANVFLFYRLQRNKRWICAVTKRSNGIGFLITT
ncbi:MAG: TIR domain-containing protein, partial [Methylococcales bacterium]